MGFAFHIEVALGAGKLDDAATADAEPNQAVTAQRVNVDPKCEFALYRRPPAAPSASVSAHLAVCWHNRVPRSVQKKDAPAGTCPKLRHAAFSSSGC
jgi:hypothetical protein